jgi:GPH family glycoside/pentoside/hexuronide:cation symporter
MVRLTTGRKLGYGAGDTALSLLQTTIDVYFLFFLLTVARVPPIYAAGAIFLGKTWDWINDPLMGLITDRTRSRWGSRRPYLLFGAVPFALSFVLMWWVPPFASPRVAALYYGFAYFLFDSGQTIVGVPYYALGPDLAATYDERTSLYSWRMGFSIAAGLLAFAAPDIARLPIFASERQGWVAMGAMFAVVSTAAIWAVFFTTRGVGGARPDEEGRPGLVAEGLAWVRGHRVAVALAVSYLLAWVGLFGVLPRVLSGFREHTSWSDSILYAGFLVPMSILLARSFRHNKPFLFSTAIFLLTWTTIGVIMSVLPFFITYWLRWPDGLTPVMAAVFVSALAWVPFWNWYSRRFSKRSAYVVGMASLALILAGISLLDSGVPRLAVVVLAVLAGIGVSAAHVVPNSILPDAIEWEELRTGSRREGFYFSVVSLLNKVAASVAVPWVALVLGVTGFAEARGVDQPPTALLALRLLVGLVPGALMAAGVLFAAAYPLSRSRHERIRRLLELRKARSAVPARAPAPR